MPTYEYRCASCERNFDVVQSFHDEPLQSCPTCGAPVRKVFGSVGIVFKGSGFYKTDSRDGKGKSGADRRDGSGDGKAAASSEPSSGGETSAAPSSNGTAKPGEGSGSSGTDKPSAKEPASASKASGS